MLKNYELRVHAVFCCLNPMEGMIKGINDSLDFKTIETLWYFSLLFVP